MKRSTRILAWSALVAFVAAFLAVVAVALPAQAAVVTHASQITNSPDDTVGGAPWARDTFKRVTSVSATEGGFTVTIWDTGTFVTPAGVKGTLDGGGTWKIEGGQLRTPADAASSYNRSAVALKDSFTGDWWKRFVKNGNSPATVKTFTWQWVYETTCWKPGYAEKRTESSAHGEQGDRPSKLCPDKPIVTTSSPSPSGSSTVKACDAYVYTGTTTSLCTRFPGNVDRDCRDIKFQVTLRNKTVDPWKLDVSGKTGLGCQSYPRKPVTSASSSSPAAGVGGFTSMPVNDSSGGLPLTGAPVGVLVLASSILVGTGALLLAATRRRRMGFGS